MYSEPHTSYNSLFVTQHQYLWYIYKKETPIFRQKREKFLFHLRNAPKSKLSFGNKIQMSVWTQPNISSFRKLSPPTGGSTGLVNCIASVLPLYKFSSQFLECFFWSSLKTIHNHFKGCCRSEQQGFLTVKNK